MSKIKVPMIPLSLYIHFPWCIEKCPYCDFNSHKQSDNTLYDAYMKSLIDDVIELLPLIWGRKITSIFIGGGTPSLIKPKDLDQLFSQLRAYLSFDPTIEITLEANPGAIDRQYFKSYFELGVNRLSIGIQSLNDEYLKKIGRIHDRAASINALESAKHAGFKNINCDLMFGLPEQSLENAINDLQEVIDLNPSHISHYQLTLEPNTYFHRYPPILPQSELIESMQLNAYALLEKSGYHQYEVSAFAQKTRECRHNKNYWEFGDYMGIGAGSHGKITLMGEQKIIRTSIEKHPQTYIKKEAKARIEKTEVHSDELPFEFMLNALRLKEGVPLALWEARTFLPLSQITPQLEALKVDGLIELNDGYVRATDKGFLFLNQILERFLD